MGKGCMVRWAMVRVRVQAIIGAQVQVSGTSGIMGSIASGRRAMKCQIGGVSPGLQKGGRQP